MKFPESDIETLKNLIVATEYRQKKQNAVHGLKGIAHDKTELVDVILFKLWELVYRKIPENVR